MKLRIVNQNGVNVVAEQVREDYSDVPEKIKEMSQSFDLYSTTESELKSHKQESITEKNFVALTHISNIMGYDDVKFAELCEQLGI